MRLIDSSVAGEQPFKADSRPGLYEVICNDPLRFPEHTFVSDSLKHYLSRLIEKDPDKRISLIAAMEHQWITHNGSYPMSNCKVKLHFAFKSSRQAIPCRRLKSLSVLSLPSLT